MAEPVLPSSIRLEAMMACQLRCPTCVTGSGEIHQFLPRGYLRASDFERLVRRNRSAIADIELSNYGETFLNPQIVDIFRIAHQNRVRLTIRNGANLNTVKESALEAVVKYRVREITCSIDGASDEVYKTYRVGGTFSTVIGNIRKINEYKQRYRSKYPRLYWQFIVFGHNEHEIGKARAMAAELGMEFYTKLSWDSSLSPVRNESLVQIETRSTVVRREDYYPTTKKIYLGHICEQLWDHPQINVDGRILGCCYNSWGEFGGNAFEDLSAALNSPQLQAARRALMGLEPMREDIPCSTCDRYAVRKQSGEWIRPATPTKRIKRAAKRLGMLLGRLQSGPAL